MRVLRSNRHSSSIRSSSSSGTSTTIYNTKKFSSLLQSFPLAVSSSLLLSAHFLHTQAPRMQHSHRVSFGFGVMAIQQYTPRHNLFLYCRQFQVKLAPFLAYKSFYKVYFIPCEIFFCHCMFVL